MKSASVGETPNILVLSTSQSFRTHLQKWLPSPAVHLVDSHGPSNLRSRVEASPPALIVVDQRIEGYPEVLGEFASVAPGVPYVAISLAHVDPDNANLFEIAKGWVAYECPTRESVIEAIRGVAPMVAARLD